MAMNVLRRSGYGGCREFVYPWQTIDVNERSPAERIQSRLRELTRETRRLRQELQELLRRPEPDRTRAFSHDRVYDIRSKRRPSRTR